MSRAAGPTARCCIVLRTKTRGNHVGKKQNNDDSTRKSRATNSRRRGASKASPSASCGCDIEESHEGFLMQADGCSHGESWIGLKRLHWPLLRHARVCRVFDATDAAKHSYRFVLQLVFYARYAELCLLHLSHTRVHMWPTTGAFCLYTVVRLNACSTQTFHLKAPTWIVE